MADRTLIAIALDYPLTLRGGVSVIVESLLKHLSTGYEVLLISPDDPQELQKHPCWSRLRGHVHFDSTRLTPAAAGEFAENIGRRGVRLVHFHSGGNLGWGNRNVRKSPLPLLARAGIFSLFSAHQVTPLLEDYCAKDRPLWYKLALLPPVWASCSYTLAHTSRVLTDSRHDANQLKRHFPLLARKIDFVYHSQLDAAAAETPVRSDREKIILAVGHVARRKGQHLLAGAFAQVAGQHPDWKLLIAGPVLEDACAGMIEQIRTTSGLGDRIQLLGSHSAPQELMQRAAIFVQPSLMEALGLALQEAMFFGCACIGSDVGGIPELITHNRTGLLFPAGRTNALAGALVELIQQPDQRRRLAEQARINILNKGMTGQAMAANYEKIYENSLQPHE